MTKNERLSEFILGRISVPLVWGKTDCCMFVADAMKAMHGFDGAGWFRGKYRTRRKAFVELKKFAGGSVREAITAIATAYDMTYIPTGDNLLPGDVVVFKAKACDPIAERLSNGMTVGVVGFHNYGVISQGKDELVLNTKPNVVDVWRK